MTDHRHDQTLEPSASRVKDATTSLHAAGELNLAAAIVDVARDLGRSVPAPRGAPYFGLDGDAMYDLSVLGSFSERGIFRKYEFALDLGSGLGGRARWLAARFGCRILGVDPRPAVVAAAALLNRRAHMDEQVTFQVGRFDCLPLQARLFTHVWIVDLPDRERSETTCRESFRVLRRGGHFALHGSALSVAARSAWTTLLTSVGFVDLQVRQVECVDLPPPCRLARERLRARAEWAGSAAAASSPTAVQIFATRPA
jgi:SAM-dependent methyltransferase